MFPNPLDIEVLFHSGDQSQHLEVLDRSLGPSITHQPAITAEYKCDIFATHYTPKFPISTILWKKAPTARFL